MYLTRQLFVSTQPIRHEQDVIQGQFFYVSSAWFTSFLFLGLDAKPSLNNPVCPTT